MARKLVKRSPALGAIGAPWVPWKYTKCMNARDLSRDDDYLSHLFIEKISGIGATPLLVHRMDPKRRLPKTDTHAIFNIVQRITRARQNGPQAVKEAVNSLFEIHSVLYFIRDYDQRQINAFATHASRYLELYLPTGSIEIAQTSRYSRITGKNELCILATRPMPAGFLIAELKGSMAELTEEEDRDLKNPRGDTDGGRRDFSVIHSKQLKKNHLFLGPARFVNHDCDNNCELFRDGRYITFRTIKPIALGQELTAHYGEGYFGKNNRHCLCETCERRGKGGYAPQVEENGRLSSNDDGDSDSENESDSDTSTVMSADSVAKEAVNVNERRTRRGVYRIVQDDGNESEEDEEEEESVIDLLYPAHEQPLDALSIPVPSSPEPLSIRRSAPRPTALLPPKRRGRPSKEQLAPASVPPPGEKTSFKSVITTRGQKAREASMSSVVSKDWSSSAISENSGTAINSHHLRPRRSEPTEIPVPLAPSPKPRGRPRKYPLPDGSASFHVKEETSSERGFSTRGRSSAATKADHANVPGADKGSSRQKIPSVPSCITCSNPLSTEEIEEAESEKVKGRGKGKGKAVHIEKECHRCARHFVIWGASWPQRNPTPGSRCSLTRENTPLDYPDNLTHASLSAVDQRLTMARLAQLRRVKEMEREVEMAAESIATNGSRTLLKRKRKDHDIETGNAEGGIRTVKRRGAIQTVNVRDLKVKVENADDVSLHDAGKKGVFEAITRKGPGDDAPTANLRKRGRSSVDEIQTPSGNPPVDDDGDDRRDKTFWPALPPLPPAGDGIKRTGLLNYRPNPTLVSRWRSSPLRAVHSTDSTPTLIDDDSDGTASDEHPTTPENNGAGTPEVVEVVEAVSEARDLPPASDEDEDDASIGEKKGTASPLKGLGLIAKPNPLMLSKRIWAPPVRIVESDSEDLQSLSPERTSSKKRRKEQVAPEQGVADNTRPGSPTSHTLSDLSISAFRPRAKKGMFDDFDASSGEEDVILPGPSNSRLYLLQRKAFGTLDSTQTSLPALSTPDIERVLTTPKPSPPSATLTSSPSLAKILNAPLLTLGSLHSEFLPPSPVPVPSPNFVDAGWDAEEDSDASSGPSLND